MLGHCFVEHKKEKELFEIVEMENLMKENGKGEKEMGMGFRAPKMVFDMKEIGKITENMDLESIIIKIESMKGIGKKIKCMDKELFFIRMATFIGESGKMIVKMGSEWQKETMVFMKGIGKIIFFTGKELLNGQMESHISDNGTKIRDMEKELTSGLMAGNIKAIFFKIAGMDMENDLMLMEKLIKEIG